VIAWEELNPNPTEKDVILLEKLLQKKNIGPPVMRALASGYSWLLGPNSLVACKSAFRIYEKCWESDFQQRAIVAKDAGELFSRRGKGADVLEILLESARDEVVVEEDQDVQEDNLPEGKEEVNGDEEEEESSDIDEVEVTAF
jgi:hypothetical protein